MSDAKFMPIHRTIQTVILLLALLFSACSADRAGTVSVPATTTLPSEATSTPAGEITVAAAADLQFAFTEIAKSFEQETGYKVTLVFGSTGQLAQQIENGAPYDLFAAADRSYVMISVLKASW